jgi:hypothetical protein
MPMFPDMMASVTAPQLRALGRAYLAGVRAAAAPVPNDHRQDAANFVFAGLIHLALPNAKLFTYSAIRSIPAYRASRVCSQDPTCRTPDPAVGRYIAGTEVDGALAPRASKASCWT